MQLSEYLDRTFAGNTVMVWLWALGTLALIVAGLWLVKVVVLRRLEGLAKRTNTRIDDLAVILIRRTRFMLLAWLAITVALRILTISDNARSFLGTLAILAFLLQLGIWANGLIEFWLERAPARWCSSSAGSE